MVGNLDPFASCQLSAVSQASQALLVGRDRSADQVGQGQGTEIAVATATKADGSGFGLLGTDDAQQGDLHLFAVANQFAQAITAAINRGPNTLLDQLLMQCFGIGQHLIGDR
jgi:hypothetical protein